jgi:hypothetical protein
VVDLIPSGEFDPVFLVQHRLILVRFSWHSTKRFPGIQHYFAELKDDRWKVEDLQRFEYALSVENDIAIVQIPRPCMGSTKRLAILVSKLPGGCPVLTEPTRPEGNPGTVFGNSFLLTSISGRAA